MNVVLISTYEMGRQPFGLASPAAWLRRAGAAVTCQDLAVEDLVDEAIAGADLVAFYVPMHTATRLAVEALAQVKSINDHCHICFYGLYAPVNEDYLRSLGAGSILGGEFEQGLVDLVTRLGQDGPRDQLEPVISLGRQRFMVPDRSGLPPLSDYAHLHAGLEDVRAVGYTETTRGCKHLCRHCPIVPIYGGRFRVIDADVVLADVAQQVAAGARHITFGDPDFFNAPGHALKIVSSLHDGFPDITYDVTIKVEHLIRHAPHLHSLKQTGCLFVTSAVESIDDVILAIFDKNHTAEDFRQAVALSDAAGLLLNPTFVAFTPWTTLDGYRDMLLSIASLGLVDNVAPIQYAIRLLIPAGSKLLDLPEVREIVDRFDPGSLVHPWSHPDERVDRLQHDVLAVVEKTGAARAEVFNEVLRLVERALGVRSGAPVVRQRVTVPYLTEPWYC
ncbi:MAG: CUAEP/CCAEP-tail radical SAM protein [Actinomycetota bacterium]|nr:CUAEP/CCAEP-tail radical SAM protein [Actinomycetota bacterium]